MRSYFKQFINQKVALKKHQVEEFVASNTKQFANVDWVRIKTFIFNEYRNKT